MNYAQRRRDILGALAPLGVDAMLVTNVLNIRYLTGFTGSLAYLLLDQRPSLIVDGRYAEQVASEAPGVDVVTVASSQLLAGQLKKSLMGWGRRRIAFEAQSVPVSQYEALTDSSYDLVRTDNVVEHRRWIKDPEEVELLRQAADMAATVLHDAWSHVRAGVSEAAIAGEIERTQRTLGSEGNAAKLLVASGPRTSLPHGAASLRVIQAGEPVWIDLSCIWQGYRADLTRAAYLGAPSDEFVRIFEVVKDAQTAALMGVRPGMTVREADALMRDHIAAAGYGDGFIHSGGHGIGMGQHEPPTLSPYGDTVLQPGMAITFEPGIYLKDRFGVRLEDAVMVTDSGCELVRPVESDIVRL